MNVFLLIIVGLPAFDVLWWIWGERRLRRARREGWRQAGWWRLGLALLAGGNLLGYGYALLGRLAKLPALPLMLLSEIYIWHLVVLPLCVVGIVSGEAAGLFAHGFQRLFRRGMRSGPVFTLAPADRRSTRSTGMGKAALAYAAADPDDPPGDPSPQPRLSRRRLLTTAAITAPPLLTALAEVHALRELGRFRLRRLEVPLVDLPAALDGLKIAHISDTHVGRFTHGRILADVVAQTNALQPDLVCFTGDLIDHALADVPEGVAMLRRLTPRYGLFACEGNHDLFEGRAEFERRVRAGGVDLLLNETRGLTIRGTRVQVLGLRWGHFGRGHGASFGEQMDELLPQRDPAAFPILLAHHPHTFDVAAPAGIPLTLSGHTHGGQVMLTRHIGAGAVLFKYVSGLYRQGDAALVVSNGVGNWLPLRVNAPAEIGLLTLRKA